MKSDTSNKFIFIIFISDIFANDYGSNVSDAPIGLQLILFLFYAAWFIWMFSSNFRLLKKKRAIQDIPTSKMRSIAMGQVEVNGDVVAATETLTEPIDEIECVYYELIISELERGDWKIIHFETKSKSFLLNDDTGSVLIPGSLIPNILGMFASKERGIANIDLNKTSSYFASPNKFPKALKTYCKKNEIQFSRNGMLKKKIKVFTSYIETNKKLYVLGNARPLNESEKNFKESISIAIDNKNNKNIDFFSLTDKGEKYLVKSISGLWWKFPASLLIPGFFFWGTFFYRG